MNLVSTTARFKPTSCGWMIPILLLAFWLGARSLDARPVWADERRSVLDAYGSFWGPGSLAQVWDYVAENNPWHSPGYFLALHEWGQATGWEPPALRVLSLMAALLTIAITYRLALALFRAPLVGLLAGLVLASSAFFIHYSFEMRVYTLIALLSTLTFWAYTRILQSRKPSLWLYLLLFAGTVGLLYSHYLAAVTLVGIGLYHLLFVPKNRRWWLVSAVVIAGGLMFIPWLRYMLDGLELAVDKDDLHARALTTPGAVWSFLYMFGNGAIVLMLALVAAAVVALRGAERWLTHNLRLLLVVAFGALVTILAVNQVLMIMHGGRLRYLMPLWPLFALLIGLGIVQFRRWRPLMVGITALWVFVGLWNIVGYNFTIDLDGADFVYPVQHIARAIRPYTQPNDVVVAYTRGSNPALKDNILEFYFQPQDIEYTSADDENSQQERDEQNADMLKSFKRKQRVWVGYPSGADAVPESLAGFQTALEAQFTRCDWTTDEPDVVIEVYARQSQTCPLKAGG